MTETPVRLRPGQTLARMSVLLIALTVLSCGGQREDGSQTEPAPRPAPEQQEAPELALIGGAQDVWPFSFGFGADREVVETAVGAPLRRETAPAGPPEQESSQSESDETRAEIVTWFYEQYSLVFFVTNDDEYLISARIESSEVNLGGGLSVGMSVADALSLLGEPGYRDREQIVFFYYATTIDLVTGGNRVNAIVLSRALP